MSLFVAVGHFWQVRGYTFNFDTVVGKQIICAEEFFLDKEKDHHTLETLKDMLSGNVAVVNYKNYPSLNVSSVPWLFLTNNDNFDINNTSPENPFNSRLYRLRVKPYPAWN